MWRSLSLISLTMASGTALKDMSSLDSILSFQPDAFSQLFLRCVFGSPLHVENFFHRTNESLRRAMAFQAPFHLQRLGLINNRHLVDSTVTRRTADTFLHMNTVIEVSEVRQVVDADPLDWLATLKTRAHWFEIWAIRPDLSMTVHACRGGRHAGKSRSFH